MSSPINREISVVMRSRSLVMMMVVLMMAVLSMLCYECSGASMVVNSFNSKKASNLNPIVTNSTDMYYQDYLFLGGECKVSALSRLDLSPVYKTSESCIKTKNGLYQKSYCTARGFVTEGDCLEGCSSCSSKSERYLFPQCTTVGIGSTLRICGKMLIEDLPKVLWNIEYDNCENKKIISAKGSVTDQCEWSLLNEPLKVTCNSTDYTVHRYTGSVTECKTRIGISTGKVNSCAETKEYKCQ